MIFESGDRCEFALVAFISSGGARRRLWREIYADDIWLHRAQGILITQESV
jgi:hypothetical protein